MLNRQGGKTLTPELVFIKTKSDSLHNIKNLNLWGNDLETLELIEEMPNLQVLSLSVNRIATLKYFAQSYKLQELYLRKNNINDLSQIKHLAKLPNLKVLWLHDNPCAQVENYRHIVINHLPYLLKLDNHPVSYQERINSQQANFSLNPEQSRTYSFLKEEGREKQVVHQLQNAKTVRKNHESPSKESQYFNKPGNTKQSIKTENPVNFEVKQRNENILKAVLTLMIELDQESLQIVQKEANKFLKQ